MAATHIEEFNRYLGTPLVSQLPWQNHGRTLASPDFTYPSACWRLTLPPSDQRRTSFHRGAIRRRRRRAERSAEPASSGPCGAGRANSRM